MFKNPLRRKVVAAVAAAAVAAGGLVGLAASPASAAPATLSCNSSQGAIIGGFIPGGMPVSLPVNAATIAAPSTIDVAGTFTPSLNISTSIPPSLLGLAAGQGITELPVFGTATAAVFNGTTQIGTVTTPTMNTTVVPPAGSPLVFTGGSVVTANGVEDDVLTYELTGVNFVLDLVIGGNPFPVDLNCTVLPDGELEGETTLLQPGPPEATSESFDVAKGGTRDITIPAQAYPEITSVTFQGAAANGSFTGTHGTFSAPSQLPSGAWHTVYTAGQMPTPLASPDTVTFVASNGQAPAATAVLSVNVLGDECSADEFPGQCSLTQTINLTVGSADLSMSQAGGTIELLEDPATPGTLTLNGNPLVAVGAINQVTVVNARGDGQDWDLNGQVSDFVEGDYAGTCASTAPSTWNYRCIPGSNLTWVPDAFVSHIRAPGDVAAVEIGAPILQTNMVDHGLGTEPHTLCGTANFTSGGTFKCDADLVLVIPASAAAGDYSATLTLTLA